MSKINKRVIEELVELEENITELVGDFENDLIESHRHFEDYVYVPLEDVRETISKMKYEVRYRLGNVKGKLEDDS